MTDDFVGLRKALKEKRMKEVPLGAYVIRITAVRYYHTCKLLKFSFEIAEGAFTGFYAMNPSPSSTTIDKPNVLTVSYKDPTQRFLKNFNEAIEESNPDLPDDWNPSDLKGTVLGVVLQRTAYNRYGDTRNSAGYYTSIQNIRSGKFYEFSFHDVKPYRREVI